MLPEPERSAGGYRLYGAAELNRMRVIKHLKSLGLNLHQIKEILGNLPQPASGREVLSSLRHEAVKEKQILEERLARIDALLANDDLLLDENIFNSPSFQMITGTLGEDQTERYAQTCPEIYDQHRKLSGILDDLKWGEDYQESARILAEYFKTHPEHYQLALQFGSRWEELFQVSEDDPRIEAFARESADLVKSMPLVKEMYTNPGIKKPQGGLYQELVANVLSPAQLRYQELFKKFLQSDE